MLRIGGAAAIAGEEQCSAARWRLRGALGNVVDRAAEGLVVERCMQDLAGLNEVAPDGVAEPDIALMPISRRYAISPRCALNHTFIFPHNM